MSINGHFLGVRSKKDFMRVAESGFERNRQRGWDRTLGAEIEGHLHRSGDPYPALCVPEFLRLRDLHDRFLTGSPVGAQMFTREVHLGRFEALTWPAHSLGELMQEILCRFLDAAQTARAMGLVARYDAVVPVPEDYLSCVHPDYLESQRFQRLTPQQVRAALSVASIQFHRGCGSLAEAIERYEALRAHMAEFRAMGDLTGGRRLGLYPQWVSPGLATPPELRTPDDLWDHAVRWEYTTNPSGWWSELRINLGNGTIEVRTPDSCRDIPHIQRMAERFIEWTEV